PAMDPLTLLIVVYLLVGGAGTLWGPLIGMGFLLGMDRLTSHLGNNFIYYQSLIFGVILFLAIVFLRRGVAGTIRHHVEKRVGRVFQRAEVFAGISAIDNVLDGFHLVANRNVVSNVLRLPAARRRERELRAEAEFLLRSLGLAGLMNVPASALPFGDRRLLEV